jgi:hypothetical protein
MLRGGHHAARKVKRAQILPAAHSGATDAAIAASVGVGESTAYCTKRRFVEGNLELALSEEPRPGSRAVGQGGGTSGRYRLLRPGAGARTLDTRIARRRDGEAHRSQ